DRRVDLPNRALPCPGYSPGGADVGGRLIGTDLASQGAGCPRFLRLLGTCPDQCPFACPGVSGRIAPYPRFTISRPSARAGRRAEPGGRVSACCPAVREFSPA